jgi:hypothetical protein
VLHAGCGFGREPGSAASCGRHGAIAAAASLPGTLPDLSEFEKSGGSGANRRALRSLKSTFGPPVCALHRAVLAARERLGHLVRETARRWPDDDNTAGSLRRETRRLTQGLSAELSGYTDRPAAGVVSVADLVARPEGVGRVLALAAGRKPFGRSQKRTGGRNEKHHATRQRAGRRGARTLGKGSSARGWGAIRVGRRTPCSAPTAAARRVPPLSPTATPAARPPSPEAR